VQVGISWRKHSRKTLNFYKRLAKRQPCEEIGKHDFRDGQNTIQCAEISKKAAPKDKKEEPIPEKLEEVHN
jgi:hypothetical protein